MVRVTVLASGSKGNCTIVATNRTRIALDVGLSCREIIKRMRRSGEEPEKLSAILITHEHQDHVQGLSTLARRWNIPVYATPDTHAAWKRWVDPPERMSFQEWLKQRKESIASEADAADSIPGEARESETCAEAAAPVAIAEQDRQVPPAVEADDPTYLPCVEHFHAGIPFEIGDIRVRPFTIPHDAADPVGFLLEAEGVRIAVATDLGYMPPNVVMHLKGADLLMLESNHDVEMLRDGPYPWAVKQRVLSRVGHLSNDAVGDYLSGEYDGAAQYIVLAHLSESNNLPELARISAERPLLDKMGLLASKILLASQSDPLESICL
jgi:phosphoribosyl 1,2-cyclic phosphodiesterase